MVRRLFGPAVEYPRDAWRTSTPVEPLRILPIGPAEECAVKLLAYEQAGAQRVLLWPLADERAQLELFRERVVPLIDGERGAGRRSRRVHA